MPENKPMKMQWITVDGRQVPSILPNHWNEQKNDWDITGTKNPLPIANYTQNASGVWLPTSESNPVPTRVTGSNVEELYEGTITISASAIHEVTAVTTGEFKRVVAIVRNMSSTEPHDVSLLCQFKSTANRDLRTETYNINVANEAGIRSGRIIVDNLSPRLMIRLSNNSTKEEDLRVYIGGIK